ncbi:MAG: hypothetical protein ACD_55C00139G0004 [uncultured bacterium]|uniref:SAM-dependent methyltransferase, type 11 n=1 Tax=Citrifermentans bemidjiense (strain ATCC BAA-1014 / DSM 16622 / JCM 12645 / Bem) TaxID=404380 RepID=B5E8P0_CITBB|nr:class I SAM-dependent methyltransferase [Citrifermentans bemidjiense]ACH38625.1 SAM-dependent methyltransferase, type 11 [Citrifermentans bemidjiense Bem]EKD59151.1 MAG: hypothetical protein ACD_55C00139G0004 [uncultured bacterium]
MKLNRDVTVRINWFLDNVVPPFLRDSRMFMGVLFWLLFRDKAARFLDFKEQAPGLGEAGLRALYKELRNSHLERDTDLNRECLQRILSDIVGETVLDVGCGSGYVARRIAELGLKKVAGLDTNLPQEARSDQRVQWLEGSAEFLPFATGAADTVVCSHTLEHVVDIERAVAELRRVAAMRLIVVVPMQREYKYTFDLHLHFFPYPFSLLKLMKNPEAICVVIGNDLYYCEERQGQNAG